MVALIGDNERIITVIENRYRTEPCLENVDVISVTTMAPGVVCFEDNHRNGEFDVYFNKKRWRIVNTGFGEDLVRLETEALVNAGIGVLPCASFTGRTACHEHALEYARNMLEPIYADGASVYKRHGNRWGTLSKPSIGFDGWYLDAPIPWD